MLHGGGFRVESFSPRQKHLSHASALLVTATTDVSILLHAAPYWDPPVASADGTLKVKRRNICSSRFGGAGLNTERILTYNSKVLNVAEL